MQTVPCPQCNTQNDVAATRRFCTKCGAPLDPVPGEAPTPSQEARPMSTQRRVLVAVTALVIAPCLCLAIAGVIVAWQAREKTHVRATAAAGTAAIVTAEAAVWTPPAPISTWTRPTDGAEMVYVPAGEFLMGSADDDPGARPDEKPQHTVYLDAFWIDKTEVTSGQYQACVKAGACEQVSCETYNRFESDRFPVMCATWDQAQTYAAWVGGRLPTEAEWEKAARGTDGRLYPWSDSPPDRYRATMGDGLLDEPSPAGSHPSWPSPYGALDMAGNAQEWVADWQDDDYYQYTPARNPQGPESGKYRGVRGGTWSNSGQYLRAANRQRQTPDTRSLHTSFRVVVAPGPPGPSPTTEPAGAPATATPDPCTGWWCTLEGVVYAGVAESGSELEGAQVELSHVSWCSPTRGEQQTATGNDGAFEFRVYLHDTDSFWFQVEMEGFESTRQSLAGFDCLYCKCPPLEIVLPPVAAPDPSSLPSGP